MKRAVRFFAYPIAEATSKSMHRDAAHFHAPEQHVHGHAGHRFVSLVTLEDVFEKGFMVLKISKALSPNETWCSTLAFMRVAGIA